MSDKWFNEAEALNKIIEQLKAENARLREALEFYADENNYVKLRYDSLRKSTIIHTMHPAWKLAAQALKGE